MLLWYLFLLVPILAAVWCVWAYRKQAAHKAAVSSARMQELLAADLRPASSRAGASSPATASELTPQPTATQATAAYSGKARLLGQPEILLFYVLKTGLPEHEIFARVNLAAVVDVSQVAGGSERERRLSELARHDVDFVICDKSFGIVAAVEFEAATQSAQFKTDCLKAAGIRHIRVKPAAIPKRDQVRGWFTT